MDLPLNPRSLPKGICGILWKLTFLCGPLPPLPVFYDVLQGSLSVLEESEISAENVMPRHVPVHSSTFSLVAVACDRVSSGGRRAASL